MSDRQTLAQDVRLELAAAAAAHERHNRPRFLVLLAIGAMILAGAYTLLNYRALQAARQESQGQAAVMQTVQGMVAELRAAQQAEAREVYPPDPSTAEKLRSLAMRAGISEIQVNQPSPNDGGAPGVMQMLLTTNARNQQAENIIQWLDEAVGGSEIPGLGIQSLKITPGQNLPSGAPGWNIDVVFTRLERRSV